MDRTDAVRPDPPGVERTGTERVEELEERLVLLAQDLVNVRRRRDDDVERAVARERELLLCGWLGIVDDLSARASRRSCARLAGSSRAGA
jgi:molecular chaperone GrpE (heat shock protein)